MVVLVLPGPVSWLESACQTSLTGSASIHSLGCANHGDTHSVSPVTNTVLLLLHLQQWCILRALEDGWWRLLLMLLLLLLVVVGEPTGPAHVRSQEVPSYKVPSEEELSGGSLTRGAFRGGAFRRCASRGGAFGGGLLCDKHVTPTTL